MEMENDIQIEKGEELKLPKWLWVGVCFFSVGVGGFFGVPYQWPGVVTASVGGFAAGLFWCWLMERYYANMHFTWWGLLWAGAGLGMFVGMADGIWLNLVGVTLVKAGYNVGRFSISQYYYEAIKVGIIFGVSGGFLNGLLCGIVLATIYEPRKKRAMQARKQKASEAAKEHFENAE